MIRPTSAYSGHSKLRPSIISSPLCTQLDRVAAQINRPLVPRVGFVLAAIIVSACCSSSVWAQQLTKVFPPGTKIGTTSTVKFTGVGLKDVSAARCNHPGIQFQKTGNEFTVTVAADTPAGLYDVQVVGSHGVSSTRTFVVSTKQELVEEKLTDPAAMQQVSINDVVNGSIDKGDVDSFRFQATKGARVVIECWADRIDSALRAMLVLCDGKGKRLAINRGFFGVDPAITFVIPADGEYIVKLHDLVYSGGAGHFYRLEISDTPRILFSIPPVVQHGKDTRLTLYGWNLNTREPTSQTVAIEAGQTTEVAQTLDASTQATASNRAAPQLRTPDDPRYGKSLLLESASVILKQPRAQSTLPVRRNPAAMVTDGMPYYFKNAGMPLLIGVVDTPVVLEQNLVTNTGNNSAKSAQRLPVPVELAGQLTVSDERDWYRIEARRGEVFYVEAFGERIDSPVDLDISIVDAPAKRELASFHDEVANTGGVRFPSSHLDPAGRFVAPADGHYFITVRNLIGGIADDPRRVYRLSVRRWEPDVDVVAIAHSATTPAGINLQRGGRTVIDVLAFRRRGLTGSIRVSARNLPTGITCPDVWFGPGVNRAPLVVSASEHASQSLTTLDLISHFAEGVQEVDRPVQSGTMIRRGLPTGHARLTGDLPVAVAGEAAVRITANGHETRKHQLYGDLKVRYSPGCVLDVAVTIDRRNPADSADVKLIAEDLPESIANQTATIPAGQNKGYISFYLPHTLAVGTYSFTIRANTTVLAAKSKKPQAVTLHSNVVTFQVHPAAFRLELDVTAPKRIKRGEIIKVGYSARRLNGFISKIHTELAAPGKVSDVGRLRGRGSSFTGQTETGSLQVIANDDAPLGTHKFLRLYAVGVLEDEAVYHGSCFLPMEIIE